LNEHWKYKKKVRYNFCLGFAKKFNCRPEKIIVFYYKFRAFILSSFGTSDLVVIGLLCVSVSCKPIAVFFRFETIGSALLALDPFAILGVILFGTLSFSIGVYNTLKGFTMLRQCCVSDLERLNMLCTGRNDLERLDVIEMLLLFSCEYKCESVLDRIRAYLLEAEPVDARTQAQIKAYLAQPVDKRLDEKLKDEKLKDESDELFYSW